MERVRNAFGIGEDSENAKLAAEHLAKGLESRFPDKEETYPKRFFSFEAEHRGALLSALRHGTAKVDYHVFTIHGGGGGGHNKGGGSPWLALAELEARGDTLSFRMLRESGPDRQFRAFVAKILRDGLASKALGADIKKVIEVQKRG